LTDLSATDHPVRTDEAFALEQDAADPLAPQRERFAIPLRSDGSPSVYLAGQSLGAQPRTARDAVVAELDNWARLGVEGHFREGAAWVAFDEPLREPTARLVGALPDEVATMNTLTVNLHLLMASFFRPGGGRDRILIDAPTFPSDRYAVESQLRHHGLDPAEHLVVVGPRAGESTVRTEDLETAIHDQRDRLAVALLAGVNYATGHVLDIPRLTAAVHEVGALAGWQLAHSAGNVPLALHDWDVDFAMWCTYKYLCGGPGSIAQVFINRRLGSDPDVPRLTGWWGNAAATRFRMAATFEAGPGADGWRMSTPPVLAIAPVRAAMAIFDEVGMTALRAKSLRLTPYLAALVDDVGGVEIVTPRDPEAHGCQLSLRMADARGRLDRLASAGVIVDFREPDIIRVAPVPMYNTFHDAWRFAQALAATA
jgi:kynureninase